MAAPRDFWSGRTGFILATTGSAIGLGSIWKFPYEVGVNGGGAFVLFYLAGVTLIVFPLMLAEFAVGRRGKAHATEAIREVAVAAGASARWALLGAFGIVTAFLILSFYSVIGGWAIAYAVETAVRGLAGTDARAVQARFDGLLGSPLTLTMCHAAFMLTTAVIVARGVARGIENACRILMPILIALIILLGAFSLVLGDVAATLRFLFRLDPAHVTWRVALDALGLGFFSIGVGLAIMVNYAAYAAPDLDLRQVAVVTIAIDTAVSVIAGLAVFPVVFAEKLNPASGPGLMFVTLPLAFAHMPGGTLAAIGFFVLLVVAALASAISLLEMPVAFLSQYGRWSRRGATIVSAGACWLAGLATVLSFNRWAGWHPLAALPGFATAGVFDLLDHLTSNMMLPFGGLMLALFAGWALPPRLLAEELRLGAPAARVLQTMLRYLVPAAIALVGLAPLLR